MRFFTYIGFEFRLHLRRGVPYAAARCFPLGFSETLVACALLYTSVALVLTGVAKYTTLNNAAPVANVLKELGYEGIRRW